MKDAVLQLIGSLYGPLASKDSKELGEVVISRTRASNKGDTRERDPTVHTCTKIGTATVHSAAADEDVHSVKFQRDKQY